MNYLAHLYLADDTGTSPAGSVLGDAVKGRLRGDYPPALELGIRLHRRIDSFTDAHPVVRDACARFEAPYRRYAGILLDIYFDHLLARQWEDFHPQPLAIFSQHISATIWQEWPNPPLTRERIAGFPAVLESYAREDGVTLALQRVSRRAARANPMAQALPLVQSQHALLVQDFAKFFPDLIAFVRAQANKLKAELPGA